MCLHISKRKKSNWGHVLFGQTDSHHSLNAQSLKAPPRQTTVITGLIGPSLGKMVYFHCTKQAATPLPGFVASSRGLLQEEGGLPKARTSDGFDPNAYKLIKRSGYDFSKPSLLGSVIEVRLYGLNDTKKMIPKQGGVVVTPIIGLSHVPS